MCSSYLEINSDEIVAAICDISFNNPPFQSLFNGLSFEESLNKNCLGSSVPSAEVLHSQSKHHLPAVANPVNTSSPILYNLLTAPRNELLRGEPSGVESSKKRHASTSVIESDVVQLPKLQFITGSFEGTKIIADLPNDGELDYPMSCSTPNYGEVVFNYITPMNTSAPMAYSGIVDEEVGGTRTQYVGDNNLNFQENILDKSVMYEEEEAEINILREVREDTAMNAGRELETAIKSMSREYIELLQHQRDHLFRKSRSLSRLLSKVRDSYLDVERELERKLQLFHEQFQ